jgi:hypothetical protein
MDGRVLALGTVGVLVVAAAVWGPKGSRTLVPGGSLAALTDAARAALPAYDFVFPEDRSYPIYDHERRQKALVFAAAPSNRLRRYRVQQAVFAREPALRVWWNGTPTGQDDPANPNSWLTTLHQYQAALPRVGGAERTDIEGEIAALTKLVDRARRAA